MSDPPPAIPSGANVTSVEDYERWVVRNATHFTCSVRKNPGRHDVTEFKKLSLAIAAKRAWDKKPPGLRHGRFAIVYAVIGDGRSAMIAEKQFAEMLALRGEA